MNEQIILQCSNLGKRFQQGELDVEVLRDVNLQVHTGQRMAIMGASGSGKTTLLHLLAGLEKPTRGEVLLDGVNLNSVRESKLGRLRNRSLGFIFQFHHLLGEFTVLENVAMPLLIAGIAVKTAQDKATELLQRVGLGHRIAHKPGEISGGERQRAAVARALINRPRCVLADEPTGNLDSHTAEQVYELMLELNQELGVSFLVVTHDERLASRMDTILHMEDGRLLS